MGGSISLIFCRIPEGFSVLQLILNSPSIRFKSTIPKIRVFKWTVHKKNESSDIIY